VAANKVGERGTPLQCAVPTSSGIKSGDPVLLGTLAMVANESDGDTTRPSTGIVSFDLEGVFNLPVVAKTSLSPSTGSTVNPGDTIYADGGTKDTNTGITTGFTLDKNSGGTVFGTACSITGGTGPLIASGSTATIAVRLKEAAIQ
jgi:predicted RecA/RadA family phage recombinase